MKRFYQTCLAGAAALCLLPAAYAAAPQRIAVDDEAPKIYCVSSQDNTKGVYTITSEAPYTADKISGSTYVQWSFKNSGGTFTSKEKAVGTCVPFYGSTYVAIATAQGGEDGPWSHTLYTYQGVPATLVATDMAYDHITQKVYGWFNADAYSVGEYNLGIFDAEAKSKTVIGGTSQTKIVALACDKDGQLWGIAANGDLYAIDKNSGSLEKKGNLGISCSDKNQSAAIDHATGKLYWATSGTYAGALYEVNIAGCTATKIYDFPDGERFNGLYIGAPDANPAAPAAPIDFKAAYSGTDNGLQVSFTVPTKTHGGDALTGNITYTIEIDGKVADTGSTQPGANFSKVLDTTPGSHSVAAYLSNANGDSPEESAVVFIGFDTPAPLAAVKATLDGNTVNVTWDAPAGVNGGDVDPAKLKYSVVRNPGAVNVATDITTTSCSETIPEGFYKNYTYTVTVYYENEVSSSATSNNVSAGAPYQIPYSQNFNSINAIGDEGCRVINDSKSPYLTWVLAERDGNKYIEITGDDSNGHKAYFFTAPISMQADTKYELNFDASNTSDFYGSTIRIMLTTAQSNNSSDFVWPWLVSSFDHKATAETVGKWVNYKYEFTAPAAGDYCICFLDEAGYWYSNTLGIDNIRVFDPTMVGVAGVEVNDAKVTAANGRISASAPGQEIRVFTTDGRLVAKAADTLAAEPGRGAYIVVIGQKAVKVIL